MKKLMLIGSIGLALTSTSVRAGLRAWEPADYVQTDLVLHYDGIRNAGADAAHDSSATTWKDLSPSGNDASAYVHASASDNGAWGNKGFVFATDGYWKADKRTSVSGDFTMQVACDTTQDNMQGTKSWPNLVGNNGKGASDNTDELSIFYHKGNKKLRTKFLAAYLEQDLSAWNCEYATLIRSGAQASLFDGKEPSLVSTSKTGDIGADILVGGGTTDKNGAGAGDRYFTGTIYSVRIYDKALSNAELAWNRALDEARFRRAPSLVPESSLPASANPDAVVATSLAGAEGAEANGCYVVDADGYIFRAAPFAKVGGTTYACTGYTLAKWNGSAWGAAVAHDGEFACFVAPSDKVRIEWQWEEATGSLDAGYLTEDLALRLDGIDNAGVGVHDASAAVWKDLSGNGRDAYLAGNADGTSYWTDKGFYFNFNAVFSTAEKFAFGTQHTFEVLMDGKRSDWWGNTAEKDILVPSTGPTGAGGIYYKAANEILCHRSDATTGNAWNAMPGFYRLNTVTYLAALRDNAKTALITGTTYPETEYDVANGGIAASQNYVTNAWLVGSKNLVADPTTWLVGGRTTVPANTTKGTVKSVRLYNRLLTEEELAHNRAIDEARFFGKIPATGCVVVQSAVAGLEGREPSGIYFPDGWTFSAGSGTNTVRGIGWVCAGYQLQTWDDDSSTWGAQQTVLCDGGNIAEYTPSGTSFASVRITWLWKPVKGIRAASDYAVDDYVVGGAQLHLDGLAHGDSDTIWSDLSGNGRNATLAGNPRNESHWVDDGYFFASNAVFATADTATGKFSLGHAYTMQAVSDVNFADNLRASNAQGGTFVSPIDHYAYGSIWIKSDGTGTIQHRTGDTTGAEWNMNAAVIVGTEGHATYLTALRNGNRTALLDGTAYPTTSNTIKNQACIDWSEGSKDSAAAATRWGIGSASVGGGSHPLYGTVKSIRLYDRMLTEDELAWNRKVDEARFNGALTTTNVVIETKYGDGTGETLAEGVGAYEVFGAHTFSATEVKDSSKGLKPVAGCYVWTWKDGAWSDEKKWHEGTSYDYTTDQGTVKIMWSPRPKGLVLIVR